MGEGTIKNLKKETNINITTFKDVLYRFYKRVLSQCLQILTEEDPRFGSCNEFTIGMSRSPRHSRDTLSSHATNFEPNQEEAQKCNQRCTNHERKSSCN